MSKQIPLVILGSARKKSDTKLYVDFVFNETDHKLLDLLDYNIASFNYDGIYPSSDDFKTLTEEILNHEIIIFATPVYWYSMSGHMKILFDRLTDLVTIQKTTGRKLRGKSIFLLAVGSDDALAEGFEIPFKNTANYLDMRYKGYIYFSTVNELSDKEKSNSRDAFVNLIKTHNSNH